jgi:hypothetical protein
MHLVKQTVSDRHMGFGSLRQSSRVAYVAGRGWDVAVAFGNAPLGNCAPCHEAEVFARTHRSGVALLLR